MKICLFTRPTSFWLSYSSTCFHTNKLNPNNRISSTTFQFTIFLFVYNKPLLEMTIFVIHKLQTIWENSQLDPRIKIACGDGRLHNLYELCHYPCYYIISCIFTKISNGLFLVSSFQDLKLYSFLQSTKNCSLNIEPYFMKSIPIWEIYGVIEDDDVHGQDLALVKRKHSSNSGRSNFHLS